MSKSFRFMDIISREDPPYGWTGVAVRKGQLYLDGAGVLYRSTSAGRGVDWEILSQGSDEGGSGGSGEGITIEGVDIEGPLGRLRITRDEIRLEDTEMDTRIQLEHDRFRGRRIYEEYGTSQFEINPGRVEGSEQDGARFYSLTPDAVQLNDVVIWTSDGDPNGSYTGAVGSIFLRKDGGPGTTFYVKETDETQDTGWVAK